MKRFLSGTLLAAIIIGAAGAAAFGFFEGREERLGEAERERPVKPPIRVSTENGMPTLSEAVIWWQDRAWIYRRIGLETFARNQIATELPAPGGGYIVSDLPADTEIVSRGAQLLLSEEFRAKIQAGEGR